MRHGESAANVFDRGGAQPDDGGDRLTEHGWAQARGLAERLRGEALETIVASPMTRAQETAAACIALIRESCSARGSVLSSFHTGRASSSWSREE